MDYLISYFAVGIILASAALLHGTFASGKSLVPIVATILLWPLLVFFSPDSFLNSGHRSSAPNFHQPDVLKAKLASLADAGSSALTEEERRRLSKVAEHGTEDISIFADRSDLEDVLAKYWDLNVPPEIYHSFKRAHRNLDEDFDAESQPLFSRAPPDWYVGFSHEFVKSIAKADRNKQGRILQALGKIASAPMEVCGDTIKPLTGDCAGLWRCRMGDDRLIYYPDTQSKKIVLISFGARGDAYQNTVDVSTLVGTLNHPER